MTLAARASPVKAAYAYDRVPDIERVHQRDAVEPERRPWPFRMVSIERNSVGPKPRRYGTITRYPAEPSLRANSA